MIEKLDEEEEEKNNNKFPKSKDITTSTNSLNSSENNEQQEEPKEKEEKITIEDLSEIIGVDINNHIDNENGKENTEETTEKTTRNLSQDEILDKEFEIIKKNRLKKYLMENNQFKTPESDAEFDANNKKYTIKPKRCQLFKFVGKTLFVFLDKYENPILIIGPHWGMYVCFCGIISILMASMYFTIWKNLNIFLRILGHIGYWTYFISYTHVSLFNPGYPKNDVGRNFGYPRSEYYLCNLCNFYLKKSNYAHHCLECDICIENHDHHCPWTGHCIGKNNIYSFYVFVGSSFFIIIYIFLAGSIGFSQKNVY